MLCFAAVCAGARYGKSPLAICGLQMMLCHDKKSHHQMVMLLQLLFSEFLFSGILNPSVRKMFCFSTVSGSARYGKLPLAICGARIAK